jgi:hypothetical protein
MAMGASVGRMMLANVVGFRGMSAPAAAAHAQVPDAGGNTRQHSTSHMFKLRSWSGDPSGRIGVIGFFFLGKGA